MEIGSFIELQLPKGLEFYKGEKNVARLNSGRAAIWHALRLTDCGTIWIPYYQCESVREFLLRKGANIRYYHINEHFEPTDLKSDTGDAVLLVNYFGILSKERMAALAASYDNVIIDNSQAFFCEPVNECLNVYSCRKFIGVPDGAYVIGENAEMLADEYEQCYSSDTSLFLLRRIEYGCEGKTYQERTVNEARLDAEDCKKMSRLTRYILDGTDYSFIENKRKENYHIAESLFETRNRLHLGQHFDASCVPMVYPLLIEDDALLVRLLKAKHFQGHWWQLVRENPKSNEFEKWISRYMIPITIDQRYGREELEYIKNAVLQ